MASPPLRDAYMGARNRWKRRLTVWKKCSSHIDLDQESPEATDQDTMRHMNVPFKRTKRTKVDPAHKIFNPKNSPPRGDAVTLSGSLGHRSADYKSAIHGSTSSLLSDQDFLHVQPPKLHPYFRLPIELQLICLDYLPYNTLLALRLTSKHFAQKVVPYSILIQARESVIASFLSDERQEVEVLLTVPETRTSWDRFAYQDGIWNEVIFGRLENYLRGCGDEPPWSSSQVLALKATEYLRCYTCLELKSVMKKGEFFRVMTKERHGLGGSNAQYRMCRDCMLRKNVDTFYGRWWRDADARQRDVVAIRNDPLARLISRRYTKDDQHVFDGKMRMEQHIQPTERAVCSKCHVQLWCLYWGCTVCFEMRREKRKRTMESRLDSWKSRAVRKVKTFYYRNQKWLQNYTGMSCSLPSRYAICHPRQLRLSRLRNLVGGQSLWRYRSHKKWIHYHRQGLKRQEISDPKNALAIAQAANAIDLFDEGIRALQQEWKPHHAPQVSVGTKHWEVRCLDCWSDNYMLSSMYDVYLADTEFRAVYHYSYRSGDDVFCEDCKSATSRGKEEKMKRRADKKKWLSERDGSFQGDDLFESNEEVLHGIQELFGES